MANDTSSDVSSPRTSFLSHSKSRSAYDEPSNLCGQMQRLWSSDLCLMLSWHLWLVVSSITFPILPIHFTVVGRCYSLGSFWRHSPAHLRFVNWLAIVDPSHTEQIMTLYAQRPIVEKHKKYAFYHPFTEAVGELTYIFDTLSDANCLEPPWFATCQTKSSHLSHLTWCFTSWRTYDVLLVTSLSSYSSHSPVRWQCPCTFVA